MERFLEANFKKILIVFVALVAAVVMIGIIRYSNKASARAAAEAFASAKTVEDCDIVIAEHKGTLAAGNALLMKADLLWAENKKDSSVAALKEFLASQKDHPFVPMAALGLASKLDVLGERTEARTQFENVINHYGDSEAAALAQGRLGDLLWAEGQEAEAKAAYEAVPVKFANADTSFIDLSENRMTWISAKLPTKEVDGPPKPVEPVPAAPAAGAPQLKLNSGGTLSPTLLPAGVAPTIEIKPTPAPAPVAPVVPAPAATSAPVPAPVEAPAVPAAPAAPAEAPAEKK
jgi:predicted negative regulator of RcsB-dependent stress response